jgi:hypothetical protein
VTSGRWFKTVSRIYFVSAVDLPIGITETMPRIYVQADNSFASLRLRQIRVIGRITTSAQIIETAVYRNAATAAGHEVVAVSALDNIPTAIATDSITDDLVA